MRVAHFIQRYPPALGGSEAWFARLSRFLATAGDQVRVFTTNALDLEAFWSPAGRCLPAGIVQDQGVEVKRYPLWRCPGRRYLLKPLSLVPIRTWQCLTLPCNPIAWSMWVECGRPAQPFDVVHASAFPYAFPIACARRLARQLGVPWVLTPFLHLGDPDDCHDRTRQSYTAPALFSLIHDADRVLVQTPSERQALLDRGVPEGKVVLQGLGVDPAECTLGDRQRARAEWGVGAEEVVIGHLANNSVEKGSVDLLRAVAGLFRRQVPVRVVLAGPEMPNFRRFWSGYDHAPRIERLGVLDDRQKRDFFAGLDLFALPSRSDSFGLVVLEAWANGLPVVGYRAGGLADLIRHEVDGLLIRCGDLTALETALAQLLPHAAWRRRLGEAGRERIQHEFLWSDKLNLVRRVYEDLTTSEG